MKRTINDGLEFFVIVCLGSVVIVGIACYETLKVLLYPARIARRQLRFRDNKSTYYVAYEREPIFGPELYITKNSNILTEIECWFSGTFKECFEFLKQNTKETKDREKMQKLLKNKKCNVNEFFYDNEFNDYDETIRDSRGNYYYY